MGFIVLFGLCVFFDVRVDDFVALDLDQIASFWPFFKGSFIAMPFHLASLCILTLYFLEISQKLSPRCTICVIRVLLLLRLVFCVVFKRCVADNA